MCVHVGCVCMWGVCACGVCVHVGCVCMWGVCACGGCGDKFAVKVCGARLTCMWIVAMTDT